MKIKDGFVLREVAGSWIVLPLEAETINFSGMLTLNDSGKMLWELLKKGCSPEDMVKSLLEEYEVSEDQAKPDVEEFIEKLVKVGCVEK